MNWQKPSWDQGIINYSSPTIIKQEAMIPFLLSEKFAPSYNNKNILDIGCGPGHIAQIITNNFKPASYLGVDFSDLFISFAREITNPKLAQFVKANVLEFESEEKFDTILAINIIPTFSSESELDIFLDKCRSLLKDSGTFVLMTTNSDAILKCQANDFFQAQLIDIEQVPIKCILRVKTIDGTSIEFSDNCWGRDLIKSKLEKLDFNLNKEVEIGGTENFKDFYPFVSFILSKGQ